MPPVNDDEPAAPAAPEAVSQEAPPAESPPAKKAKAKKPKLTKKEKKAVKKRVKKAKKTFKKVAKVLKKLTKSKSVPLADRASVPKCINFPRPRLKALDAKCRKLGIPRAQGVNAAVEAWNAKKK